jgi:hypothetical protein
VVGRGRIDTLRRLKDALVEESEINRLVLRVECTHLSGPARWIDGAWSLYRAVGPAIRLGGPLLGLLIFRKRRRLSRARQGLRWLGWIRLLPGLLLKR